MYSANGIYRTDNILPWKLNCITNTLHARIWNAYIQPIIDASGAAAVTANDFIGNNQVVTDRC